MIESKINELVNKLNEIELLRKNTQEDLLSFCQDKSFDINKRFDIWEKYCDKKETWFILDQSDFKSPLLGLLVSKINPNMSRRENVSYHTMIEYTYDEYEIIDYLPSIKRSIIIDSILNNENSSLNDEFFTEKLILILKEDLIQENFGSYTIDW